MAYYYSSILMLLFHYTILPAWAQSCTPVSKYTFCNLPICRWQRSLLFYWLWEHKRPQSQDEKPTYKNTIQILGMQWCCVLALIKSSGLILLRFRLGAPVWAHPNTLIKCYSAARLKRRPVWQTHQGLWYVNTSWPESTLRRKPQWQICLLTAAHRRLNGQNTIAVVKGAGHTKTHWEYTAPADQWPHPDSVSFSKAARPKSSEALSAMQITNQHQTPNKGTSTSFKSN